MSEEKTARTKLDLLYQETLGDVARLIERTERVNDKLRETATALLAGIEAFSAANVQLQALPEDLANTLGAVLDRASMDLTDQVVHNVQSSLSPIRAELKLISADTSRYARFAHISARKMTILALVVGTSAGAGVTTLLLRFLAS
ncbi:hypothetical protein MTR80_11235 [Alcaligenes aquatilis]|uniref:StbC n=1 Tax=Alcaligenes aquatilis TaxID=323284 RepID=A0ABY4NCT8_9BURK|nr:hypothetical protein [Alcaligenes aquatilis]UQN34878.1 hypothetical protein MTR80_11235 [Alcaligenes aquatilis]